MNATLTKNSNVSAELTLTLDKNDYAERVEKALKDFRRKASMPGFRPGQAPMAMLRKRFGKEVLAEELNKALGEKLYEYIKEQNLNILGEPMANVEKQPELDFDTMEEFTFVFDLALAPEVDAVLSNKDKLTYYNIEVSEAMIDEQANMYASQHGEYTKVDDYQPRDMVKGTLKEVDGDLVVEDAVMLPEYMKNEDQKAKFNGAKKGEPLTFNPFEAYNGSEVEMASMLHIDKAEVENHKGDFTLDITEITRYTPAAMEQKLFDDIFGEGNVEGLDGFRAKIKENIAAQLVGESEYKFMIDLREHMLERNNKVEYDDTLLKRIIKANRTEKSDEDIEKDLPQTKQGLTWQMIMGKLAEQFEIKLEMDDILGAAKELTRLQFAQYGMANVGEDIIERYASEMIKDKTKLESLQERAVEKKVAATAKATVKLTEKTVSMDDFKKLFEK